ncbi:KdsC family phosphatase [Helicobacter cappadocius]|uniref:3-deoxy-D-manno-octulosonate 8-phosphate phosphatase KdsC n=1 Tax=Helicobacter cappadocius TaxID=3063998 RepID=A0AA90SSM9_9HELI|nr:MULTISPECIES: HAD family hydrolase [unclassified Helicobacter]MDO7253180.1 HAD hydrolase family protein [Helicobacter sp. faydin-H75]MDP2539104.1 HAD hydrolase family protein [Helicobacter sp. faydin-H76]
MIELVLLDVDGTLTDGKIIYNQDLCESKVFNVKDGLGLVTWQKLGKKVAIISGRNSPITEFRAKELGISCLYMGIENKKEIVLKLKKDFDLQSSQIACIGDDLNDLPMFAECGLCFTPSDGNEWLQEYADVVLKSKGGEGAVREMIEYILIEYGLKDEVLKIYQ